MLKFSTVAKVEVLARPLVNAATCRALKLYRTRNRGEVLACYTPRAMGSQKHKWAEAILCVWIVAAQVWYYLQFREQFRPILSQILRKLWH